MAILKKTTVVAKPAAKTAAKPAAKPVVKATVTKVMTDSKTGKATKSAPVAMKSKSITAKEFNTDGKVSKAMSNGILQKKAMDKIASYSSNASKGFAKPYYVGNRLKRESPTDSVIKYSNELMKLRKKK